MADLNLQPKQADVQDDYPTLADFDPVRLSACFSGVRDENAKTIRDEEGDVEALQFWTEPFGTVTLFENGTEVNVTFEKSPATEDVTTGTRGIDVAAFRLSYSVAYCGREDKDSPCRPFAHYYFAANLSVAMKGFSPHYGEPKFQ